jgi:hypothetical protein
VDVLELSEAEGEDVVEQVLVGAPHQAVERLLAAAVAVGCMNGERAAAPTLPEALDRPALVRRGADHQPAPSAPTGERGIPGPSVAGCLEAEEQRPDGVEEGGFARLVRPHHDRQAVIQRPAGLVEPPEPIEFDALEAHQRSSSAARRSSIPSASASSSRSPTSSFSPGLAAWR